jgi:hypothetical protein
MGVNRKIQWFILKNPDFNSKKRREKENKK